MFPQIEQNPHRRDLSRSSSLVARSLVLYPNAPASSLGCGALPPPPPPSHQLWNSSDSLLTHFNSTPAENTIFFPFCLVNKRHQTPGRCGKWTFWWQVDQVPSPRQRGTSCEQGARGLCQISDPNQLRELAEKGWGGEEQRNCSLLVEATCYITSSISWSSQPSAYFFSRWALRGVAVVIKDIPAPLQAGAKQLQGWQKGRCNCTSDAIKVGSLVPSP